MKTIELIVSGRVQGVGFRYMTKLLADQMHVFGTVQNLADGRVKIVAQSDPEILDLFTKKVKASPSPSGRVDALTIQELFDVDRLHSFSVIG